MWLDLQIGFYIQKDNVESVQESSLMFFTALWGPGKMLASVSMVSIVRVATCSMNFFCFPLFFLIQCSEVVMKVKKRKLIYKGMWN
jgi:hypothetical protein